MPALTRQDSLGLAAGCLSVLLLVLLYNLPATTASETAPTAANALRVQLDPETGELVPVRGMKKAELTRRMEQHLDRSTTGLNEIQHADGSVSMNLDGRFRSLSLAVIDSTGGVHTECVTSKHRLYEFMNNTGQEIK